MRRVLTGLAACGLALGLTACPEPPPAPPAASLSAPIIEDFEVDPRTTTAPDQVLTLTVDARDPKGRRLSYTWSANKGTLSRTTGKSVTWKPTNPNGSQAEGYAQVRVEVSNGELFDSRTANLLISAEGGVTVVPPGSIPVDVVMPTASPVATPEATGTTVPAEAEATGECSVGDVLTTWAEPGSAFQVGGMGLKSPVTVTVGGSPAAVKQVAPERLTAIAPTSAGASAQMVSVTACGETTEATGSLWVADLGGFAGPITSADTGLTATVYPLSAGASGLPAGWSALTPLGTFLGGPLDMTLQPFAGFPVEGGRRNEWYAVRFRGQVAAASAGEYRFALFTNNHTRLYVGDELLVEHDGGRPTLGRSATVQLRAGQHPIRLEHFHGAGAQVALQLYWQPPGAASPVIVPVSAFRPE